MKYEFWFAGIRGIPVWKKIHLHEYMKSAEAVYYIEETQLRKMEALMITNDWVIAVNVPENSRR